MNLQKILFKDWIEKSDLCFIVDVYCRYDVKIFNLNSMQDNLMVFDFYDLSASKRLVMSSNDYEAVENNYVPSGS